MKTYFLIIISFLFFTSISATDVSGNQFGTWNLTGSPYNMIGNITIPTNETLEIESGVEVIAMGNYKITALGNILAVGTQNDTIRFHGDGGLNWGGLRLEDEITSNLFYHCRISNTDDTNDYGIQSINSPVTIEYSYFDDHQRAISFSALSSNNPAGMAIRWSKIAYVQKSGITVVDNSNVLIISNEITRCGLGSQFSGAIQLSLQNNSHSCSPTIFDNYIHHNEKQGITLANMFNYDNMAPTVEYNEICYNYTGIYLYAGNGTYSRNNIHHNFMENNPDSGAGVMLYGNNANAVFTYNEIHNNYTGFYLTDGATANLGNLNNANPDDDGFNCIYDNIFFTGEEFTVYNASSADVTAENNVWDDDPPIDVTIIDGNDNPAYGIVDYEPILSPFAPPDSIYLSDQYVCEIWGIAYPTYLFPVFGWDIYIDGSLVANMPIGDPYIVTDLVNGQTYELGVSLVYEDGASVIIDTTFIYYAPALNPPLNVVLNPDLGILFWEPPEVSNATLIGYHVYLDGDLCGITSELEWQYAGLVPGQEYEVGVSALYEEGESDIVEVPNMGTYISNPPTNASYEIFDEYVRLTWQEPEPGSTYPFLNYRIYLDGELLEETTELFYDIYDLIQGQLYTIGITALYEYLFESNPISLPITFVGSDDILKLNTKLLENYPNPFNPTTTISFTLSADDVGKTKLEIYNLKGQKIRHYSIENNQSSIIWNGTDQTGKQVSSGIYFYRLISDGKHIASKKMLLLK
jgi:hypothetical protein